MTAIPAAICFGRTFASRLLSEYSFTVTYPRRMGTRRKFGRKLRVRGSSLTTACACYSVSCFCIWAEGDMLGCMRLSFRPDEAQETHLDAFLLLRHDDFSR